MTSPNLDWHALAVDRAARDALAARGLDYRSFTSTDADAYAAWLQVVARGFLDGERSAEQVEAMRERSAHRRITGVYDVDAPDAGAPVASLASWIGELSVPGGGGIPSCAISAVTVAPTHRRRGIARALMEGELRVAAAAGVPVAMLTVSESTIYGRFGFAPAAASASLELDVKRARWTGPSPRGRVDFISRQRWRELVEPLHERVRHETPGEIDVLPGQWDTFAGTRPDTKDAGKLRAIQYADAAGEVTGLAVYSVEANHDDFTKATVTLSYLLAATDDAYAGLWRFFVELDLVATVETDERSVDEALVWMIDDRRAATVTVRDHHYLRLLDVPAALAARRYGAPGSLALEVDDPLGITGGRWLLRVDAEGQGRVEAWDGEPGAVPVRLGVAELSAVYLGGVSLATLARAGRVQTTDAAAATRVFAWHVTPALSIWY